MLVKLNEAANDEIEIVQQQQPLININSYFMVM